MSSVPRKRTVSLTRSPRGGVARRSQGLFLAAALGPITLIWAVFWLYPLATGLYGSFTDWRGFAAEQPFVGLRNYRDLLADPLFLRAVANSALFTLIYVPPALSIALLLALAIESTGKLKQVFRTVYFLPFITSVTATALIWGWLFQPQFGLFNQILSMVGLPQQRFLRSPAQALPAIAVYQIWKELGFNVVICIAGLTAIDRGYYEAARVDGATPWQIFWRITLPLLQPTLALLLMTNLIWSFQLFGPVFIMSSAAVNDPPGGPLNSTLTVAVYQWQMAFRQLRLGYGAAIGGFVLALSLAVTLAQARLLRQRWEA
jgi:multiple sugar transport system permease protein